MKKLILAALALFAPSLVSAQVGDGSMWSGGGATVTVNVSMNPITNTVTISVTQGDQTSSSVTGTPWEGSTVAAPAALSGPEMSTEGGLTVRVSRGKLQRQRELRGKRVWVTMRRMREKDARSNDTGPSIRSTGPSGVITATP